MRQEEKRFQREVNTFDGEECQIHGGHTNSIPMREQKLRLENCRFRKKNSKNVFNKNA